MGQLEGKVAIVTGGARGQGRAHALALAREGADVALWDIAAQIESVPYPLATPDDLQETVNLVEKEGRKAVAVVADIRSTDQVTQAMERTQTELGVPEILVANAAVCGYRRFVEMPDDVWDDLIDTNLTGTFKTIRAALPGMIDRGYGRIIVTSSGAGRTGAPNLAHYVASKWGVIGLVKTVALEAATTGVTANVICPGTVRTPMVENDQNYRLFCPDIPEPTLEDALPRLATLNPMEKPWLEPEAIARAMLYFACDDGSLSGTVLEVSQGSAAYRP
jgi:SDR family mycofactocin-dependent oxidoreductase